MSDGAAQQAVDGAQIFQRSCSSCHTAAADSRAPSPEALRSRSAQAVLDSLITGAMRAQGSRLSGAERRAVAEFVSGTRIGGDVAGAGTGRCPATSGPPPRTDAPWAGWSPAPDNTRFQTGEQAGLAAGAVPRLTLKWAFGFPDASVAWSQPTVAEGRVFVGSQNGTVYALDAKTGCIHWTFAASGGVRTARRAAPGRSPRHVTGHLRAADELGDGAPLGTAQARALRPHGSGHQAVEHGLDRAGAQRVEGRRPGIGGAGVAGTAAGLENLCTISSLLSCRAIDPEEAAEDHRSDRDKDAAVHEAESTTNCYNFRPI